MKPDTRRRLLRYGVAAFAALAVAQGVRVFEGASRDVELVYHAPDGALRVELRDEDGERLRRADFDPGAPRRHTIQLPDGTYQAVLSLPDRRPTRVPFAVRADGPIEVRWSARAQR